MCDLNGKEHHMNYYDYATALAFGLDRWASPKSAKPYEEELNRRRRFEQARNIETAPISGPEICGNVRKTRKRRFAVKFFL